VLVSFLRPPRNHWSYLIIIALCALAFLDESGYGVEIFGWQPLYIAEHHVYIHDLHSLFDLGVELAGLQLADMRWNGALFTNFALFDLGLVIVAGVLAVIYRSGLQGAKEAKWQERIVQVTVFALASCGLAAAGYLLALPGDPKNAILFGYSAFRLGSVLIVLVPSLAPLAIWLRDAKGLRAIFAKAVKMRMLPTFLGALAFGVLVYQVYATFVFLPDDQARLERITPLLLWALAICAVLWVALAVWAGKLRRPFTSALRDFIAFLEREPAFFYTGVALALIFIAQLIDQDIIPLNTLIVTPNFHVRLWGLWTEETFEMTGAVMFILAAFFFPKSPARKAK
jgi:hypothetical protein